MLETKTQVNPPEIFNLAKTTTPLRKCINNFFNSVGLALAASELAMGQAQTKCEHGPPQAAHLQKKTTTNWFLPEKERMGKMMGTGRRMLDGNSPLASGSVCRVTRGAPQTLDIRMPKAERR